MIVDWVASNGTNGTTCFMAHMGIQVHVMYEKMINATNTTTAEAVFEFDNTTDVTALACNSTLVELYFNNTADSRELWLTFEATGDEYSLQKAMLSYTVSEKTFPNATSINMTVDANSTFSSMFMTPKNMSYQCTRETQFWLATNNTNQHEVYIRFTPGNFLMLQAFDVMNKTYGAAEKCFVDQPPKEMSLNKYVISDDKNNTCAFITTLLELTVNYTTISGEVMSTVIPLLENTTSMGSCEKDSTHASLVLDQGAGNLLMIFKKVKSFYRADIEKFALDTLTLSYSPESPYFMNHQSMDGKLVMVTESGLGQFVTTVGNSYKCNAPACVEVNGTMNAMFNTTHIQAFDVKNDTFGPAEDCQADFTTSKPPVTKPIVPDDINPTVYNLTVMGADNKTICLHATIGIQMRTKYNKTDNTTAEAGFNFNEMETTVTSTCNSTTAVITFERTDDGQILILTFMNDTNGETYLSAVEYEYTINGQFPNASGNGTKENFMKDVKMHKFLGSSHGKSYVCNNTETDVLVDEGNNVVLRVLGVQVEPFAMSEKYAAGEKCFSDMPQMKAETGRWFINETSTKDNSTAICARFAFASSVNVTYMSLLNEMQYITIPLDGTKNNASDGSFGMCEDNKTTLVIPMDDKQINFTFTFVKNFTKKGSTDEFDYMLKQIEMEYSPWSKYFPNHAYVEGTVIMMANNSLNLFKTDKDHSYKCNANVTANFTDSNTISLGNVQVQPFGVKDDGSFLTATDCAADDDLSPLIPIIVGSVLAGLVVVVLIAYVIGRRRNSGPGYESI